jgi:heat shock protein HslJ
MLAAMTPSRPIAVVLGLVLATCLTACAESYGRSADSGLAFTPDLADLSDDPWVATRVEDPDHALVPGSELTLTFTADSVTANAGCNTLRGRAKVDDDELVVDEMASTMMACEGALSDQDVWLTTFLTSRPTIERLDDNLWLSKDDTVVHLVQDTD